MDKLLKTLLALVVVTLAASCAKEPTEDATELQDELLEAWVSVKHPDKLNNRTASGAYILEYEQGTGDMAIDTGFVFVHYLRTDLEGNITDTNIEQYSKQVAAYEEGDYCGCDIWQIGVSAIYEGIEDVLKDLKVGGHVKLAIPPSATDSDYTVYDAFPGDETSSFIFDLTLEQVEDDIYAYQEAMMKAYSEKYFGGVDTTSEGFYFIDQTSATAQTDTITDGETLKVWYIGRRLDGSVFDTNIQDTAKKYNLYTSDGSYDALEVDWTSDLDDMVDNADVVTGFAMALYNMKYGSSATTFFWSKLGYGLAGSSPKIGEYSPMAFTLSVEYND